jgi:hypothetical protein
MWQVGRDGACEPPGRAGTDPGDPPTEVSELDYYVIHPPGGPGSGPPGGLLVEEFVLGPDHAAVRLDGAGWTAGEQRWWSAPALSRALRADPRVRARVTPVDRYGAEILHRRLGGADLPDEADLRARFEAGLPLDGSAPLRLDTRTTSGFHETRSYRILCANAVTREGLARLAAAWRMTISEEAADPQARVIGTAHLRIGPDSFTWYLRRVGAGAAWCLDLTADLAGVRDDTVRPLLRRLVTVLRYQGLVPVTLERFS